MHVCILLYIWIRNTPFFVSFFSPYSFLLSLHIVFSFCPLPLAIQVVFAHGSTILMTFYSRPLEFLDVYMQSGIKDCASAREQRTVSTKESCTGFSIVSSYSGLFDRATLIYVYVPPSHDRCNDEKKKVLTRSKRKKEK